MQKRSCCRRSTDWRKRRHGIVSRSAKPEREGRLIQEGAILEKVLPEVRTMEPSVLEDYLMQKLPQHD